MPRLMLLGLLIANLRGDFPEGAIGHIPTEEAHRQLVEQAGEDLGLNPKAWEKWLKTRKEKRSPSAPLTLGDVTRELRKRRRLRP